jgi:hypothetical protein
MNNPSTTMETRFDETAIEEGLFSGIETGVCAEQHEDPTRDGESAVRAGCDELRKIPWYAPLFCLSGIHFGSWGYAAAGNCGQARSCLACGKVQMRTRHHAEWQYLRERVCTQARICTRCGVTTWALSRTRHDWDGKWGNASEQRECKRCGKVQTWDTGSGGTYYD